MKASIITVNTQLELITLRWNSYFFFQNLYKRTKTIGNFDCSNNCTINWFRPDTQNYYKDFKENSRTVWVKLPIRRTHNWSSHSNNIHVYNINKYNNIQTSDTSLAVWWLLLHFLNSCMKRDDDVSSWKSILFPFFYHQHINNFLDLLILEWYKCIKIKNNLWQFNALTFNAAELNHVCYFTLSCVEGKWST